MNYSRETLANFHGLVKNRLGPHKIVVRQTPNGMYWCENLKEIGGSKWVSDESQATDYSINGINWVPAFCWKVYLTTSAGDIWLTEKDLKK
jgi:hypothetical protein